MICANCQSLSTCVKKDLKQACFANLTFQSSFGGCKGKISEMNSFLTNSPSNIRILTNLFICVITIGYYITQKREKDKAQTHGEE